MLDSGKWKETSFKEYNFKTLGESVGGGYLHPLLKVSMRLVFMSKQILEQPIHFFMIQQFNYPILKTKNITFRTIIN